MKLDFLDFYSTIKFNFIEDLFNFDFFIFMMNLLLVLLLNLEREVKICQKKINFCCCLKIFIMIINIIIFISFLMKFFLLFGLNYY